MNGKKFLSINAWLILINIFAFALFTILISTNIFKIDYVAIMPSNILNGMYLWTFITSIFMHGGFFHLFANMLSLVFLGSFMERILGRKRYFWFYLFAGIFAGVIFVISAFVFPQDMNTYAVGASGALFGIAGLMIVLTPNLPLYVMFIPIPVKAKYAVPGLLIILWLISIAGNVPIGNSAHFGGLIAGLAYGLYLRKRYKKKSAFIKRYFS